jgi:endonuclease YncB( thermonuclease family)
MAHRNIAKALQNILQPRVAIVHLHPHVSRGVAFKQVQKYENGKNRITAVRLFVLSHVLRVPVAYFFEGLKRPKAESGRRSRMVRNLGALFCVLALVPGFNVQARADEYTGQASVVDVDTLEIHGKRIRLSGIDASESDQLCRGDDSLQYRCGAKAANALDDHIAGRPVSCEGVCRDQYGVLWRFAQSAALILGNGSRAGLAFDWPRHSKGRYTAVQTEAERAGRGVLAAATLCLGPIWACIRNGGRPSGCSNDTNAR